MPGDWIKLHRKIIDSQVGSDDFLCRLWVHCMCRACWKPGCFMGEDIPRGSFGFRYREFAAELGVSKSKLERAVRKLEQWGQVSISKPGRKFTLLTVCNYESYQDDEPAGGTHLGHIRDTSGTHPGHPIEKERKEVKEGQERSARVPGHEYFEEFVRGWNAIPWTSKVEDPTGHGVTKAWQNGWRKPETRQWMQQPGAVLGEVRRCETFLRSKSWFCFAWLFKREHGGAEQNVCKLMSGRYRDGAPKRQSRPLPMLDVEDQP